MRPTDLQGSPTRVFLPIILGATLLTLLFAASAWAADRTSDQTGGIPNSGVVDQPSSPHLQSPSGIVTDSLYLPVINGGWPTAVDDSYTTDEDMILNVAAPGVLGNDNGVHGNPLSVVLDSGPSNGALTLISDGAFVYTSTKDYYGKDSFTYVATDEFWESNVAKVTITIDPVSDKPVAENDEYESNEDETLVVTAPGVLGNDTDADGDLLIASLVTSTREGTLTLTLDGSFVYDPNPNFNGTDSFTYSASDGTDSDEGTATITVNPESDIKLTGVWTSDGLGIFQPAFPPATDMAYHSSGRSTLEMPVEADIQLIQSGPCESGVIYSDTLGLEPGEWHHEVPSLSGDCAGVYTTTTQLNYTQSTPFTLTLSTRHVVNHPSQVILSEAQGFDKCFIPTLDQMQTWWDESPYSVFNLYIGGISFYCDNQPMDATWVHRAAQQGWTFIQTWVGPQAPCTGFNHRMSWNPEAAYIQGELEALYASQAARQLGFLGEQVIYYDMEGYTNEPSSCSRAVDAFMQGWVDGLHDLGLKAGGYGSSCRSYIFEWADNQPPPDDVWMAHWHSSYYNPNATVWDLPCVSNDLWPDHQRIKQYTGGHKETWGGEALTIDSNVLDGAITAIPMTQTATALTPSANPVALSISGPQVVDMGLRSPEQGWALVGDRLLTTQDGGQSWIDITPNSLQPLGAAWGEAGELWVVGWDMVSGKGLQVGRSHGGGLSWDFQSLESSQAGSQMPVEAVTLEVLNRDTAWVSLKMASGSSFSLGRLFATQDGGRTWEQRELPIAGPVRFIDAQRGWLAGGPANDQLYATRDGGRSWQLQRLELPQGARAEVSLPTFTTEGDALLPVSLKDPQGDKLVIFASAEGSQNWRLDDIQTLDGDLAPGVDAGLMPGARLNGFTQPASAGVVVALDFMDELNGWAVVQEGACQGEKRGPGDAPLRCDQRWRLMSTRDGGLSWREISPQR